MSVARNVLDNAIEEQKRKLALLLPIRASAATRVDVSDAPLPSTRGPMMGDAPDLSVQPISQPFNLPTRGTATPLDTSALVPSSTSPLTPTRVDAGTMPTLVTRNDRGRPTGVIGGEDDLARNVDLLKAQQGYHAPHSWKDLAKSAVIGFLQHGIPGAAASSIGYELDQPTRNRMAVGSDMAQTQRNIQQDVSMRNQRNDWLNDESNRGYKDAQTERLMNPTRPGFNLSPGQHRVEYDPKTGQPIDVANLPDRPTRANGEHNPLLKGRTNEDGSVTTLRSDDYGKTWQPIDDLTSAPPPQAPPEVVPDTATGFAQLEQQHRDNAVKMNAYADAKEAHLKKFIKENPDTFIGLDRKPIDPKTNPDAAAMIEDIKQHRDLAGSLLSKAEQAASQRVEAANRDAVARAKVAAKPTRANRGNFTVPPNAKGRKWSRSRFAASHPGADVDAAAKTMVNAGAVVVQ